MSMSHEAYEESADRRPSNKESVLQLLLANMHDWVLGSQLREWGGSEATRRVRELRKEGWIIRCAKRDGQWSYCLRGKNYTP